MRIDTPEKVYRVIRVLRKERSFSMYLAVDFEAAGSSGAAGSFGAAGSSGAAGSFGAAADIRKTTQYLLLELMNPVLGKELMLYRMEHGKERSLGFIDCFVKEGTVWAVFPYHAGHTFREAAESASSQKERITLWEGLLGQLFLQKMPMYLRYEAASPDNVVVDETAAVWVNYELFETDRRHDSLFPELQKRLHDYFCMLFADHPACGEEGKAADYAVRLAGGKFDNEAALYREWYGIRALLLEEKEQESGQGGGMLFKCWRWLLSHTAILLQCGYWLAVLALWVLFFVLCFRSAEAPEQRDRIEMIGTVEIEDSSGSTAAEDGERQQERGRSREDAGEAAEGTRVKQQGGSRSTGSVTER